MEKLIQKLTEHYVRIRTSSAREQGQAMVEYALILFLVSVVAILVLTAIGENVTSVFESVRDALVPGT